VVAVRIELLGRHVQRRAAERALSLRGERIHQLGKAEVGDLDHPIMPAQQIGRLEIAVENARGVRRGQAVEQLA
jgi:hypothetical protein